MRSIYEIKAQKELESQGWLVDYKMRPSRPTRGYHTDYFNLFDLMAYRAGDPLRLISIKGHQGVRKQHRQDIQNFWLQEGLQKEIWHYLIDTKHKRRSKVFKEIIP